MLIKLIDSGAQDLHGPAAQLIKRSSRGLRGVDLAALEKRAGVDILRQLEQIKTAADEPLIHLLAIGATEWFSANRNGDGFKEAACRRYHQTFTKFARFYRDHCFPAGEPVLLADRSRRPIEEIRVGDLVITTQGAKPVTRVFCRQYSGAGFRIRLGGLPAPLTLTAEHPVYVLRRGQVHCRHKYSRRNQTSHGLLCREFRDGLDAIQPAYVSAATLQEGDYLLLPRPRYGRCRVEPAFARLVGWIGSEGHIGKAGSIQFTFSSKNQSDIASVTACLQENGLHAGIHVRDDGLTMVSAQSVALCRELSRYVTGTYSNKRLTGRVLTWNATSLHELLTAYIDGDGSVARGQHLGKLQIRSSSPAMLAILADIVRSLGLPVTVNYDNPAGKPMQSPANGKTYYGRGSGVVAVNAAHSPSLLTQSRKRRERHSSRRATVQQFRNYYLVPIRQITAVTINEPVYNLEVAGPHDYVVRDVVVHNCNKRPECSYGLVKWSGYNDPMHRIELIVALNGSEAAARRNGGLVADKELHKLASGADIPVSMACVLDPAYPVLTRDRGYVGIADVQVGDYVWTKQQRWRRVTQQNRRRYTGPVCEFHVNGLPGQVALTADHPMWAKCFVGSHATAAVKTKARRYFQDAEAFAAVPAQWVHAGHVTTGDRFFYQPITGYSNYGRIADVALATVMGYYLAEGSFGYNGERACLTEFTCHMDDSLPRRLPRLIESMFPDITVDIKPRKNSKPGLAVVVNSTEFSEFLRRYVGRGVLHKVIPPEIFNATREIKLAFLGAWLDGDGWVDKKGGHWSTCNYGLALQGRDLLATLGIPSSIYQIDHSKCPTSGYASSGMEYTLNVAHLDLWNLSGASEKVAAYPVPSHAREKPASMRRCPDGSYAYRVASVTTRDVVNQETYNIEVEEDESYSLGGLVSHNCRVPADFCSWCGNRAASRDDYCDSLENGGHCKAGGLKYHIGEFVELEKAGQSLLHHLHADNRDPAFFDISHVLRNADRIAFVTGMLEKAASSGRRVSGAELAETLGIGLPYRLLVEGQTGPAPVLCKLAYQLSDLEAEIEAAPQLPSLACGLHAAVQEDLAPLPPEARTKFAATLAALAAARICLPVPHFLALTTDLPSEKLAGAAAAVQQELPGVFTRLLTRPDVEDWLARSPYRPAAGTRPALQTWAAKQAAALSVRPADVQRRTTLAALRGVSCLPQPCYGQTKQAAVRTDAASQLAGEYARYQLAFLSTVSDTDPDFALTARALVLQNYVQR